MDSLVDRICTLLEWPYFLVDGVIDLIDGKASPKVKVVVIAVLLLLLVLLPAPFIWIAGRVYESEIPILTQLVEHDRVFVLGCAMWLIIIIGEPLLFKTFASLKIFSVLAIVSFAPWIWVLIKFTFGWLCGGFLVILLALCIFGYVLSEWRL